MADDSGQIAELLQRWAKGDREALGALAPVVYKELRRLAHKHLRAERAGHTVQSTALVNEAFIRLLEGQPCALTDRGHFIAVASRSMRQILVEHARGRAAQKRDGGYRMRTYFEAAATIRKISWGISERFGVTSKRPDEPAGREGEADTSALNGVCAAIGMALYCRN